MTGSGGVEFGARGTDPSRVDRPCLMSFAQPKILLYSHDSFGIGNIRRSLALGEVLNAQYPRAAVLLVTGSPLVHAFRMPGRMDYVKLPCVDRVSADPCQPRFLTDCAEEVRHKRSEIIERTAVGFNPDLFIVDKLAAGLDGELLPTLGALHALPCRPRIVLGLRDILDAPEVTRRTLRENGSFEVIERYYDETWIYGSQAVFDAVAEYDFPRAVAARTRYCGYLRRRPDPRHAHIGAPRILVTTGRGADGERVIRAYLEAVSRTTPGTLDSVVILGPQLARGAGEGLRRLVRDRHDVRIVDFEPDVPSRYASADVVVSMAGYDTVCELLSAGARAVLVPPAGPVQEQLIRARRLTARGNFLMVEPAALAPESLMTEVRRALDARTPAASPIEMEGLSRVRSRVHRLLEGMAS